MWTAANFIIEGCKFYTVAVSIQCSSSIVSTINL